MKRGVAPIVFGIVGILAAGIWYWTSRPDGSDVRTAEILGRTPPEAATAGPIVLAIAAAFTILCGVVLYATANHPHQRNTPPSDDYAARLQQAIRTGHNSPHR